MSRAMKQSQIPGTSTISTRLRAEIDANGRHNLADFYEREGLGALARNRRARRGRNYHCRTKGTPASTSGKVDDGKSVEGDAVA